MFVWKICEHKSLKDNRPLSFLCFYIQCPKPVIAAVHDACIGAGVDLISACDIRYCTSDAWFQIKVRNITIDSGSNV